MMIDIAIRSDGKKVKKGFFSMQKKRKKSNQINNLGVVFWVVGESVTFGEWFKDKYLTKWIQKILSSSLPPPQPPLSIINNDDDNNNNKLSQSTERTKESLWLSLMKKKFWKKNERKLKNYGNFSFPFQSYRRPHTATNQPTIRPYEKIHFPKMMTEMTEFTNDDDDNDDNLTTHSSLSKKKKK